MPFCVTAPGGIAVWAAVGAAAAVELSVAPTANALIQPTNRILVILFGEARR
jgi:hypothetical protein